MTHPDEYGRRGPAREIVDLGDQRPRIEPRVQRPVPPVTDAEAARLRDLGATLEEFIHERGNQPPAGTQAEVKQFAAWWLTMPWGDVAEICDAIMGGEKKPTTSDELARAIHGFCKEQA